MATSLHAMGSRIQFALDFLRTEMFLVPNLRDVATTDEIINRLSQYYTMVDSSTDVADEDRDCWKVEIQELIVKAQTKRQDLIDNPPEIDNTELPE